MKLVLITAPGFVENEEMNLLQFLEQGLDRLHIRKPDWGSDQIKRLLSLIPERFYPKISLHGHERLASHYGLGGTHFKSHVAVPPAKTKHRKWSKSFHQLEEILAHSNSPLDYAFLSPVFNSISKKGYQSVFDPEHLCGWLSAHKSVIPFELIALGGIHPENISLVREMGFGGFAVMGAIWEQKSEVSRCEIFKKIIEQTA